VKSEPTDYSIDDLARDGSVLWTGIRNYQARNFIRDGMGKGDFVLYYHSGGGSPEIVGAVRIEGGPVPDPTQFDSRGPYYDPKSSKAEPRWWSVSLEFVEKFPRAVSLQEVKGHPKLQEMSLLKRSRLSVHPVEAIEFETVRSLGKK
jgi:predicted RNA-binding protein with PUA-like domain